ncbi:M23 family metallopeptidase [Cellulomonas sp. 73-145]|uniref:M23 family metallopeptidase n=1 Tax=Cellulomonas sp. 73-145 TaxID=1895739 RepID=UPI0025C50D25|nr:M23 family metallopeptidase [Cellulomonas sp. 73-145]
MVAAAVSATLLIVPMASSAAQADDLSNKRTQTQARIRSNQAAQAALDASLEDLSADLAQAVVDLQGVQTQVLAAQQKLDEANATYEAAQREASRIGDELADARDQQVVAAAAVAQDEKDAAQVDAAIGRMARQAYQSGAASELAGLSTVLGADDLDDFVARIGQAAAAQRTQAQVLGRVQAAAALDRGAQARLAAVRDRVDLLKKDADQQVATANQAKAAASAAKDQVDQLLAAQTAKQATVEGKIAQGRADQARLDAQQAQLNTELAGIVAQQAAQAAAQRPTSSAPAAPATAGAWFVNPTANSPIVVTSPYGMRLQPVLKIWRLHAGIDLADQCNQPVYAGRDGTVLKLQTIDGDGNRVMIDHGWVGGSSLITAYNHLNTFAVAPGQSVRAGQLIGYAGMTGGVSTGCHLDFQVYLNGATVDPAPYLGL